MRHVWFPIFAAVLIGLASAQPAAAVVQFQKVFKEEYLDKHPDKQYAAALTKASDKCYVCHQGKSRKHHNAFGEHLEELLDRKKDMKDVEKIKAALAKVLEMRVEPTNEKSETYADRVKAGKWPAGELEELKKEPPEEEAAGN
jgi:cytochrome c2